MGIFDLIFGAFIRGVTLGDGRSSNPKSPEEDSAPDYDLLRNITPIKIHDDGVREVWLGRAHPSLGHERHDFGSTELWQIDLHAKFKGHKPFYRIGMGVDEWSKRADSRLFVPFNSQPDNDRPTRTLLYSPPKPNLYLPDYKNTLPHSSIPKGGTQSPQKPGSAFNKLFNNNPPRLTLPNYNERSYSTPLHSNLADYSLPERQLAFRSPEHILNPPEDKRTLLEKIGHVLDPMTRKCVAAVDEMARQRHEDYKRLIMNAPSGYECSDNSRLGVYSTCAGPSRYTNAGPLARAGIAFELRSK